MSTYYGLHCKTCDSHTACGKNYAEKILSDFARMSPLIKQLREMDSQGYLEMDMLGGFDDYDETPLFDWLHQHAGHEMELYNEYGRYEPLEEA